MKLPKNNARRYGMLYLFTTLLLGLLLLLSLLVRAQNPRLRGDERKIMNRVARNMPAAEQMLEQVVRINSGTMNHPGVRRVGEVFERELAQLGFETRWISMPDSIDRAGHLVAVRRGSKGKRVLLLGHLDTVFDGDSIRQGFAREKNILRGPGVNDMKGGDVLILYALRALHEQKLLNDTQIIVFFTGDEEEAGRPLSVSRRDLVEAAQQSDITLAFEPGAGMGEAVIARRGVGSWALNVTGKQAHSAGVFGPGVGSGAIFEASRILYQFHQAFQGQEYLAFNPGLMVGGTEATIDSARASGAVYGKTNVVANTASVRGDLRFISDEQLQQTRLRMREIVSQSFPETSASIHFGEPYPAMPPTEGNRQVLQVLDQVSRAMGNGPVEAQDPGSRGAGDVSFVAAYTDALDGLGVQGSGAHTPDESMDLRSFKLLTQRAALLIYRLTR